MADKSVPDENSDSKGSSILSTDYVTRLNDLKETTTTTNQSSACIRRKDLVGAIGQLINGVAAVVFGIAWISVKCKISESGIPVWAGIWFIATGVIGIWASDSMCLIKTYVVFSAINILFGINVVIIGGIAAATEMPIYSPSTYELRVILDAILVIVGFIGCLLALWCIISVSSVVCSTCIIDKEIQSSDGSFLSVMMTSKSNNALEPNYKLFLPLNDTRCRRSAIGQFVCGVVCLVFGVVWMSLSCVYSESSAPLFSGVFFILTGILGWYAIQRPYNTCLLITYTVFCTLCILYALGLIVICLTGAYHEQGAHKSPPLELRIFLDVSLALIGVVETSLAVCSIILVSDVVCGSCSSVTNLNHGQYSDNNSGKSRLPSTSLFVVQSTDSNQQHHHHHHHHHHPPQRLPADLPS